MKVLIAEDDPVSNRVLSTLLRRWGYDVVTTRGAARMDETAFRADDILLFGSEGAGAPDHVHARADLRVRIPIRPEVRSLNLGTSAGIALAEALRQTGGWP